MTVIESQSRVGHTHKGIQNVIRACDLNRASSSTLMRLNSKALLVTSSLETQTLMA